MVRFLQFFKNSFYLLGLFAILLAFFSVFEVLPNSIEAAWSALGLVFINFLAGGLILSWAFQKPDKIFYGYYFGGMIGRFVFIFACLFIFIKYLNFNKMVLMISLIVFYFSFLVIEIWSIVQFTARRETER